MYNGAAKFQNVLHLFKWIKLDHTKIRQKGLTGKGLVCANCNLLVLNGEAPIIVGQAPS